MKKNRKIGLLEQINTFAKVMKIKPSILFHEDCVEIRYADRRLLSVFKTAESGVAITRTSIVYWGKDGIKIRMKE